MIEWLSEIGVAVLLVLLVVSMYTFHISTVNILLVKTEVETVKFVTESGLVKTLIEVEDLYSIIKTYTKYNKTLGLKILPGLNITISDNGTGFVKLYIKTWSDNIIPSLNYSLIKVVVNNGVERVESCSGTITYCTNTSITYENAIYVVTTSYHKFITFKVFAPSDLVKHNYNISTNELYNSSDVIKVYAILPLYDKLVPCNFTKYDDHVKLEVEYGVVSLIIVEEDSAYIVNRITNFDCNAKFRRELNKYVICEYYTLMVMVGERI